jgi:signal transduction histidine kinase
MKTDRRSISDRRSAPPVAEDRIRSIVEQVADGIVVISSEGIIRFANPAAERLFSRTSDDLVGTYLGFPAVVGESAEIEVVRRHGDVISVELRVVESEWEGRPALLASLRDISDRRRAEERAAQLARERVARAKAEAASEAKSEFLAMMSHELRTPLNAILGYTELLELRAAGSLHDEQRAHLVRIRDSAHHLLALVNEVLDLAKGEAGRLSLTCAPASAADVVDASLSLVQPTAEARAISLSRIDEGGGETIAYDGDETRVRQILVNLLTNAVKFSPAGGRITVAYGRTNQAIPGLESPRAGAWVYLRVVDAGVGIPEDKLPRIFDPFVQVERGHTRTAEGSGLGLAICRRLARLMKGDVTVQSQLGTGSTFTLWLPAVEQDSDERSTRLSDPTSADDRLRGLAEIGTALQRDLRRLLEMFSGRLREEMGPKIASLRFPQLADHLAAYVATIASTLIAVEDVRGQPSSLVADGSDILRLLADRHGAQRQRLGWTSQALIREWQLLSVEVHRTMRGCAESVAPPALAEASTIIDRFIAQASEVSLRSFARGAAEEIH